MLGRKVVLAITLALLSASLPKLAQANQSTQTTAGILDDLQIAFGGWGYSAGFNNPSAGSPRLNGVAGADPGIWVEPQFSLSGPSKDLRWVAIPRFSFVSGREGLLYNAQNPSLGVQGVLYSDTRTTWWARFENLFPLNAGAQRDGLIANPQSVQFVSYQPKDSRFLFRSVVVPSFSFFSDGSTSDLIYISPQVWYQFNPKLKLTLLTEHLVFRERGKPLFNYVSLDAAPTHLLAGFRYDFSQRFWLQPMVNFLPSAGVTQMGQTAHLAIFFGGQLR
jgi:hypothetical protein